MTVRHFLTLSDLSRSETLSVINRAIELKAMQSRREIYEPLKNQVLGMIFEKSSTRTRVSFESGMAQFGGSSIFLSPRDTQLGRGEPIEDSARVLSRMVDAVMIRTFGHDNIETFAAHSSVPVINALTDDHHPCQLLADLQTFYEHRGSIEGKRVCWIGDGNNMCNSFIEAAALLDFQLIVSCPEGFEPKQDLFNKYRDHVTIERDPKAAVEGASLVATDVWASMGQEEEQKARIKAFEAYQVDEKLLSLTLDECLFMHCLPAHRGEEISENLLDHPKSVVWDEAENRLHAQKALLEFLMCDRT